VGSRGPRAHATIVRGCAMRHTAEAMPPPASRPSSHTSGRNCAPVCAATRGPVSAAADTPTPLHCPRQWLGCQAMFLPPVGSATRSNGRCALPPLAAPTGLKKEGTGAAALCPCHGFLSPPHPRTGALPIAALLKVGGFAAPAGDVARHRPQNCSACIGPSAVLPPSLQGFAMYCHRAPASRPGPPLLSGWRRGWPWGWRSCPCSLRLIQQPDKLGTMPSFLHVCEGVVPWYLIFSSTSSR